VLDADPPVPALVAEATKRSDVIWLAAGSPPATDSGGASPPRPAWHLWHDGAAYTVTGPGEQPLPGIAGSPTCAVTVRSKTNGGRIVTWEAAVRVVAPGGPEWDAVVPALVLKRLNLPDTPTAAARWAWECTVLRLTPTGRLLEAGATLPDA
jgi:hypothetical protein